jgi:DNA-binding XRE family transcriptional regulator
MTTKGKTLHKSTMSEWLHPDAPQRHNGARRCAMGKECVTYKQLAATGQVPEPGKVHHYQQKQSGVVLCYQCNRVRVDLDMKPRQFAGVPTPGKRQTYALPNVRPLRQIQGLTQVELAEMAGCTAENLRRIESEIDGRRASAALARRIAAALGVDLKLLRGVAE